MKGATTCGSFCLHAVLGEHAVGWSLSTEGVWRYHPDFLEFRVKTAHSGAL